MGKTAENEVRDESRKLGPSARLREKSDIFGGADGSFGQAGLEGARNTAAAQSNAAYEGARPVFQDIADRGGERNPMATAAYGGLSQGGERNAQATGTYGSLAGGGERAQFEDPTGASNVYNDFASTGGFSENDKGVFRRRATSAVPGIYNVLSAEANRRRALTGGMGTGGDLVALARQSSNEAARANTGAEAELSSQIRGNRLAGAGGITNIANMKNQQALAAANMANQNMYAGASGLDRQSAQADAMRYQGALGLDRQSQESNQNRLQGAGGLANLYGQASSNEGNIRQQILGAKQQANQMELGGLNELAGQADQPGPLDTALNIYKTIKPTYSSKGGFGAG